MSALKPIADSVLGWCSNLFGTALSLAKVAIQCRRPATYPKPMHNTCILLGNGPSLRADLEKYASTLRKHSLLCVNGFSLSNAYTDLKPAYYLMLDPAFWESRNSNIESIMQSITTKTNWTLHLYLPHAAKGTDNMKLLSTNPHIVIHYFNYIVYKGFSGLGNTLFRLGWAAPQCQNVLVAAIFIAVNAGHKNVVLLGADHSWHENIIVKDDNIVYTKEVHFYDNLEQCRFIPFPKDLNTSETRTMDDLFLAWSKVFKGYFMLKKYATSRGSEIFNASAKSYIDAFSRTTLDDPRWK